MDYSLSTGLKEKQEKRTDGVADAPRPASLRTATPTAQGFLPLPHRKLGRGCKTARNPVVGVVLSKNCRYNKKKQGVVNGVVTKIRLTIKSQV